MGKDEIEAVLQYASDVHGGEMGSVLLTGGAISIMALCKLDLITAKEMRCFLMSEKPADTTTKDGAFLWLWELCIVAMLDRHIASLTKEAADAKEN